MLQAQCHHQLSVLTIMEYPTRGHAKKWPCWWTSQKTLFTLQTISYWTWGGAGMQWTTRGTWILKLERKECKVSQRGRTESSLACIKPEKWDSCEVFDIRKEAAHTLKITCTLAPAFRTATKVTKSGFTPGDCICQNSFSALLHLLAFQISWNLWQLQAITSWVHILCYTLDMTDTP